MDYASKIRLLRIPLDENYKEVSVLYLYDPIANAFAPASSVPFDNDTLAMNVNIVGGLLQTQNLQVTSDAVIDKSKTQITTSNGWQSVILDTKKSLNKTITIKNAGTQDILIRISGSLDGEEWDISLLGETLLTPNNKVIIYNNKYYYSMTVDVRNAVTNMSSTAIVKFAGIAA